MLAEELATASLNKLTVITVIINNAFLGMVRQWQELFYDKQYAMTRLDKDADVRPQAKEFETGPAYVPDFVKLAEAYDCVGQRVEKHEDIIPALKAAIDRARKDKKPTVLEFIVAREENVYPMVPAGARLDEMIDSLI